MQGTETEPNEPTPALGFSKSPRAWTWPRLSRQGWLAVGVAGLLLVASVAAIAYYASREGPHQEVEVYVTDLPGNVTHLFVRIAGVYVGDANHSLSVEQSSFDLLSLQGPRDALRIASGRIPLGDHREVRIVFQSVRAVVDGVDVDLDIPERSLMIGHDYGMRESRSSAFLFDLSVADSIHVTSSGLQFRPHVQSIYVHHYGQSPTKAPPGTPTAGAAGDKPAFEEQPEQQPSSQKLDEPKGRMMPSEPPWTSPAQQNSEKGKFQWNPPPSSPSPSPSPSPTQSPSPSGTSQPPNPVQSALPDPGSANSVPQEKKEIGGWFVQFYDETMNADEMAAIVEFFNGQVLFVFGSLPAAYIFATAEQAENLSRHMLVKYVEGDQPIVPSLASTRAAILMPQLQHPVSGLRDAQGRLLTGQGVGVAVVDIGMDGTHPDIPHRLINPANPLMLANYKVQSLFTVDAPSTDQTSGHGTHVLGILGGRGVLDPSQQGIAPDIRVYGFGIGEASTTLWPITAFDWVVQNHNRVSPPIKIVQNSWGSGTSYDPNALVTQLIERLIREGVTVVFSAGNTGGDGSVAKTSSQCQIPSEGLICVGAMDDQNIGSRDGPIGSYSSRGRISQPSTWPDLVAPGTSVRSARPVFGTETGIGIIGSYVEVTGTSMAAPHVSGAIALMLQAKPSLSPAQIESILERTAYPLASGGSFSSSSDPRYDGSHYAKGHGLLDAHAAAAGALAS